MSLIGEEITAKNFAEIQEREFMRDVEELRGLEDYVRFEGREIIVDWSNLFSLQSEEPMKYSRILRYLGHKDILTTRFDGEAWALAGEDVCLNPRSSIVPTLYFFTRKNDALDFARVGYENAMYRIVINNPRGVSETVSFS